MKKNTPGRWVWSGMIGRGRLTMNHPRVLAVLLQQIGMVNTFQTNTCERHPSPILRVEIQQPFLKPPNRWSSIWLQNCTPISCPFLEVRNQFENPPKTSPRRRIRTEIRSWNFLFNKKLMPHLATCILGLSPRAPGCWLARGKWVGLVRNPRSFQHDRSTRNPHPAKG